MIKMTGTGPKGRPMLIIGLSEGNLGRLREGKPAIIHGEEWGQAFDLTIFWGETEDAMTKMVAPFIGPQTRVRDSRRDRKN
jgi:hypothetical protein